MAFTTEVINLLVANGIGTYGTNIFLSTKAVLPTGDGPYLSITEVPGLDVKRTQNSVAEPAYRRPGIQFIARAVKYSEAKTMIDSVYDVLAAVHNQFLDGVWYLWIRPVEEPYDNGNDTNGRICLVFHAVAYKRSK